jgi:hypothetical protein
MSDERLIESSKAELGKLFSQQCEFWVCIIEELLPNNPTAEKQLTLYQITTVKAVATDNFVVKNQFGVFFLRLPLLLDELQQGVYMHEAQIFQNRSFHASSKRY